MDNPEQDGLRLIKSALKEGLLSRTEAIFWTELLVPTKEDSADFYENRRKALECPRAKAGSVLEALERRLTGRVPRRRAQREVARSRRETLGKETGAVK